MEVPLLDPLNFYPRFALVAEQIFEYLDKKTLIKCRKVSKSWKICINERNLPWVHVVNIPTILKSKETHLHIAAKTGQSKTFKKILENEEDKNIRNHRCCRGGPRRSDLTKPKIWADPTPHPPNLFFNLPPRDTF